MRVDYSKASADVQKEAEIALEQDEATLNWQRSESKRLLSSPDRIECILCGKPLCGETFEHRGISFLICNTCGHVQTRTLPPDHYPGLPFNTQYPRLTPKEYHDRKTRIYKPKLDWVISCLHQMAFSMSEIAQMKWVEIGTGAGYFISSLLDAGISQVNGFDADKTLVDIANTFSEGTRVIHYEGKISDAFDLFPSDIYVAFFVLEHIDDAHDFFLRLRNLPPGTLFAFSVPVFGLSCLLENVFENNSARHLDCAFHTQLYTDTSIGYGMEISDFHIVSKWIFGQDVVDFTHFMLKALSGKFSAGLFKTIKENLLALQDRFQNSLDKLSFSDQRHVLAIKR